jgi:hypothetical protein
MRLSPPRREELKVLKHSTHRRPRCLPLARTPSHATSSTPPLAAQQRASASVLRALLPRNPLLAVALRAPRVSTPSRPSQTTTAVSRSGCPTAPRRRQARSPSTPSSTSSTTSRVPPGGRCASTRPTTLVRRLLSSLRRPSSSVWRRASTTTCLYCSARTAIPHIAEARFETTDWLCGQAHRIGKRIFCIYKVREKDQLLVACWVTQAQGNTPRRKFLLRSRLMELRKINFPSR